VTVPKTLTFVLVDDEPLMLDAYSRFLSRAFNAASTKATNNGEALSAIEQSSFDLIVSDMNRPGGSGLEMIQKLRDSADRSRQVLPVIIVSGNIKDSVELQLYRAGASRVMRKPVDSAQLISSIARLTPKNEDADLLLLRVGFESRDLDYKEDFDLSQGRAALAKDILAMANGGGGSVIIGVKESVRGAFEFIGVAPDRLAAWETTVVNDAVRRYVGAHLAVRVRPLEVEGRHFVLIRIPPTDGTVAFAAVDDAGTKLFRGRIYMRTDDGRSAEVQSGLQAGALIDRLVQEQLRARRGQEL
jgi:CheY-like chemotaxis protein